MNKKIYKIHSWLGLFNGIFLLDFCSGGNEKQIPDLVT